MSEKSSSLAWPKEAARLCSHTGVPEVASMAASRPVENPATMMPSAKAGGPGDAHRGGGGRAGRAVEAPAGGAGGSVEGQQQVVLRDHRHQPVCHQRGRAGGEVQRLAPEHLAGGRLQGAQLAIAGAGVDRAADS